MGEYLHCSPTSFVKVETSGLKLKKRHGYDYDYDYNIRKDHNEAMVILLY